MIKKFLDKFFPVRAWGILASDTKGVRGKCYTVLVGRHPKFAIGMSMMYERDKEGNPTKDFHKIIIL